MSITEPQVALVQALAPHYREPFFDRARELLGRKGVRFQLFYGQPYGDDAAKGGAVNIPWAVHAPNRTIRIGDRHVAWQSCFCRLRGMDLVITEQASSQLLFYALWGRYLTRGQRLALWGHGRNFQQEGASRPGEAVKRFVSRRVHWWFAYNERSVDTVCSLGFPRERITNFQNAIDTAELSGAAAATEKAELAALRRELGLPDQHVGLYVGALYREKRLTYLLDACVELRRVVPDFHLLVVGTGPQQSVVAEVAAQHPWIHQLGGRFGTDRVPYFLLADLHLMPGRVGLAVLDSFALGVPLVTVADSAHSPEVAYLRDGENGLVLPAGTTPVQYAHAAAGLMLDRGRRAALERACLEASKGLTVESMTERFVDGVLAALDAPLPRSRARRPQRVP